MPACFSRPICRLAMQLNDQADNEQRQHLLPFVTRLACADMPTVEREREAYIASRMRWCLPFREGLKVLEGALAIGRPADDLPMEEVRTRMEAAQQKAPSPTSGADRFLFSKFQGWFAGIV
jgi:hypothetical protein